MLRMGLFMQLFEAQSTGLQRRLLPVETEALWRYGLLIKKIPHTGDKASVDRCG